MYILEWDSEAIKQLNKIDTSISRRIYKAVDELKNDPSSKDIKKLKGYEDTYRLRVGDYRIIFLMKGNKIYIAKVGHRENIYHK